MDSLSDAQRGWGVLGWGSEKLGMVVCMQFQTRCIFVINGCCVRRRDEHSHFERSGSAFFISTHAWSLRQVDPPWAERAS